MCASLVNMFMTLKWVIQKMKFFPEPGYEDLPDDWQCPVCFVDKDEFEKVEA